MTGERHNENDREKNQCGERIQSAQWQPATNATEHRGATRTVSELQFPRRHNSQFIIGVDQLQGFACGPYLEMRRADWFNDRCPGASVLSRWVGWVARPIVNGSGREINPCLVSSFRAGGWSQRSSDAWFGEANPKIAM